MGSHVTAPGEQLGVRCLAQGHLSRGIEGGESAGYSLPPPTIPAGPEIRTHNLPLTSPTRYPLGHDCPRKAVVKSPRLINEVRIRAAQVKVEPPQRRRAAREV